MAPSPAEDDLSPPEFLQLAGHPLRWQLLHELAHSDRTVHELTVLVDEPQNLVSYHLGKLRGGGLVSARRSSADGRDAYYTADLGRLQDLLGVTGAALHPGLRPDPLAEPQHPEPGSRPATVLFLCTGNSARSQMAEALARTRSAGAIDACSAGSAPKPLHPNAVRAMREQGIDISGQRSTHLDEVAGRRFDQVVTLCDRLREVCPELPGNPEAVHWSIPDPATAGSDDDANYPAFQETAAELETRIGFLIAAIGSTDTTIRAAEAR